SIRVSSLSVSLSFPCLLSSFLFFTAPAPTETYPLSLHDALPIFSRRPADVTWTNWVLVRSCSIEAAPAYPMAVRRPPTSWKSRRSEEHTSELQSRENLVCRLLLEKKKSTRKKSSDAQITNVGWSR